MFVYPASDSTPHATVLSLLLQSLQKISSVVESRSRQILSLLLEFLGYDSNDLARWLILQMSYVLLDTCFYLL